jgi:hypothetical protein
MKSILTFQKWTKINVQKWVAQKVLTDRIFYYDLEKLWFHGKRNKNIL